MASSYDVIIAGAGPIGLFLACELRLANTSVLILERDLTRNATWEALPLGRRGLNTVSIEALHRRGLLDKVFKPGERPQSFEKKPGSQFGGHFAGTRFDANKLELNRWKYRLNGPGLVPGPTSIEHLETVLTEQAHSLGVEILRGHSVAAIAEQSDKGIVVEATEGRQFSAKWLVGCDGGRSAVRKLAGIEFVGSEAQFTGYAVQCDFDNPEKLQPGFHCTDTGFYIVSPESIYLNDFDGGAFHRSGEITQDHVQEVFSRISGLKDVTITKMHLASTFTDRAKQASQYRRGRILLAGDAAHIHGPLGSQGLNLGIGDAMNLGWKLAATIRRELQADGVMPDLTLLDSYHTERHPIGASVLEWVRAQIVTMEPDLHGKAARKLIEDLINTTDGANYFIDRTWGLSQKYEAEECSHPFVGCSAPDFEFVDGSRLANKMMNGHGMFIDFSGSQSLTEKAVEDDLRDKVSCCSVAAQDECGLRALLVRPDGVVAWAVEAGYDVDENSLRMALHKWFRS